MAYSGKFTPQNPQKYIGDHKNIIYRSSWECRLMNKFDLAESIISWSSEELVIPYISPVDMRPHRYFPDFFVKMRKVDGGIRTMVVEVKPRSQSVEPARKKRMTKQYIREVTTWGVNEAKWKAAKAFCEDRKWEFLVLTEYDLGIA